MNSQGAKTREMRRPQPYDISLRPRKNIPPPGRYLGAVDFRQIATQPTQVQAEEERVRWGEENKITGGIFKPCNGPPPPPVSTPEPETTPSRVLIINSPPVDETPVDVIIARVEKKPVARELFVEEPITPKPVKMTMTNWIVKGEKTFHPQIFRMYILTLTALNKNPEVVHTHPPRILNLMEYLILYPVTESELDSFCQVLMECSGTKEDFL